MKYLEEVVHHLGTEACGDGGGVLQAGAAVHLNQPHIQSLVHHKVIPKQLMAVGARLQALLQATLNTSPQQSTDALASVMFPLHSMLSAQAAVTQLQHIASSVKHTCPSPHGIGHKDLWRCHQQGPHCCSMSSTSLFSTKLQMAISMQGHSAVLLLVQCLAIALPLHGAHVQVMTHGGAGQGVLNDALHLRLNVVLPQAFLGTASI